MKIIGLDISKKSTGCAFYSDGKIVNTVTIANTYDMYKSVTELILSATNQSNDKPVVIVEGFTESLVYNDRTNTASSLQNLRNNICKFITNTLQLQVVSVTPWSWRQQFDLYTRVETLSTSAKLKAVTKSIGHDILKNFSVEYVQRNAQALGLVGDIKSDDEAEAVLLVNAYIKNNFKPFNTQQKYFKTYYIEAKDVINLTLEDEFIDGQQQNRGTNND